MIILSIDAVRAQSAKRPSGYYEDVLSSGTIILSDTGEPSHVAIPQKSYDKLVSRYSKGVQKQFFAVERGGPGTELKKILADWPFHIVSSPDCKCNQRAVYMDEKGCGWCESPEGMNEILGFLREAAEERGLPFVDMAARLLVKRAISNARKAEAKRAKEAAEAEGEARPAV